MSGKEVKGQMAGETQIPEEGDRDMLAAEFVLGVLDLAARKKAERLMLADAAFAAEVESWRERLSPLDDAYQPQTPPAELRGRIEGRLFGVQQPKAGFMQSLAFWRPLAIAASLAFIALAGLYATQMMQPVKDVPRLIATLESKDSPARFHAIYDTGSGALRLTPVDARAGEGKDFELWLVEGGNAPVSLGVIRDQGIAEITLPKELAGRFVAGTALAVSLEPTGGSPTGQATGPIVALGVASSI
jgi:anti-sigma-K factor RskA